MHRSVDGARKLGRRSSSALHRAIHSCWLLISGISLVVTVLALGFCVGLALALIREHNQSTGYAPNSMTVALVNDAAMNNKDDFGCILPLGTTKAVVKNAFESFELVVYKNDDFLSTEIVKKGFWEVKQLIDFADLSPRNKIPLPPATFFDVGANIGYYSFLFAVAGYSVVAFEPESRNAALFRASLCVNPKFASRITLFEIALSNSETASSAGKDCQLVGRVNKRTRKYLQSIPQLNCDARYQCRRDLDLICQRVPVTTLKQFFSDYPDMPQPDILKLDVEGQELQVLEGMLPTHKATIVQYENTRARLAPAIATILTDHGYTIGTKRGHDSNTVAELNTAGSGVLT